MLYDLLRSALFSLPPEKAHDLTLRIASLSPTLGRLTGMTPDPRLSVKVGSVQWSFPVGLAAGLDKNAEALAFFSAQGFGAIECGTVTLAPQLGNPLPRMFRYPEEKSIRNAMGFPNQGLERIKPRLKAYDSSAVLGVNMGKNKHTTPEGSIGELCEIFRSLEAHAGYFVVNVSSPNTPCLRALQEAYYLKELFRELHKINRKKDLYLKISPDLSREKVIELTRLAYDLGLTGLIATNTTIMAERGTGGVSGDLLKSTASDVRQTILSENLPIELIGVGGISSFEDLLLFWAQGGKVVQAYTAYVYQGPRLLRDLEKKTLEFLAAEGLPDLESFFRLPKYDRLRRISQRS